MAFYDLSKAQRNVLVEEIKQDLASDIAKGTTVHMLQYFADEDTYIRKSAYLAIGKLYLGNKRQQGMVIQLLERLLEEDNPKIRQTSVNAAGEIGKTDFAVVRHFFDTALFDKHHSVRNAVIGSMKKMGEKNPVPILEWSAAYLKHPDKEIRREICHGIELRGRTHPEDILPLLYTLQWDKTKRVRWTLVHVIGQISYKKGCLEKVINTIVHWENKQLVDDAIYEIIDVHHRYRNFSFYTQDKARSIIETLVPAIRKEAQSSLSS